MSRSPLMIATGERNLPHGAWDRSRDDRLYGARAASRRHRGRAVRPLGVRGDALRNVCGRATVPGAIEFRSELEHHQSPADGVPAGGVAGAARGHRGVSRKGSGAQIPDCRRGARGAASRPGTCGTVGAQPRSIRASTPMGGHRRRDSCWSGRRRTLSPPDSSTRAGRGAGGIARGSADGESVGRFRARLLCRRDHGSAQHGSQICCGG